MTLKLTERRSGRKRTTKSATGESPKRAGVETYEHLLISVEAVLTERDSLDFSLTEVAAASGMSAALVQYHFGSKDGLLLALLERRTAHAVQELVHLTDMNLNAEKKLQRHVRGLVSAYFQYPYINRLLHHMMNRSDPERAEHIAEIFIKPVVGFHERLLQQGVREGVFVETDPMHFYFILVGACDHMVARRQALSNVFGVRELTEDLRRSYTETLYRIIRNGIAVR